MKSLVLKYKGILLYGIFGVLTTLVNLFVYYVCYEKAGIANVPATVIAWIAAVTFAFITNKRWVFESKAKDVHTLLYEVCTFFGCRVATGILEVALMYLFVDAMKLNGLLMKLVVNVIVIILNYVASKLVIFKKTRD